MWDKTSFYCYKIILIHYSSKSCIIMLLLLHNFMYVALISHPSSHFICHTFNDMWRKFGLAGSMGILHHDKGSLSDIWDMKDLKH